MSTKNTTTDRFFNKPLLGCITPFMLALIITSIPASKLIGDQLASASVDSERPAPVAVAMAD